MYNTDRQLSEQKRKLEKMNMVLNNLEQKLGGKKELCQGVAKIIDMTVENNELVSRLESIRSNIPEIQLRVSNLISSCNTSCNQERTNIMLSLIHSLISENGQTPKKAEYILKIQRTIDYCINDYLTYKQSNYNARYCTENPNTNTTNISSEDLLMLL